MQQTLTQNCQHLPLLFSYKSGMFPPPFNTEQHTATGVQAPLTRLNLWHAEDFAAVGC